MLLIRHMPVQSVQHVFITSVQQVLSQAAACCAPAMRPAAAARPLPWWQLQQLRSSCTAAASGRVVVARLLKNQLSDCLLRQLLLLKLEFERARRERLGCRVVQLRQPRVLQRLNDVAALAWVKLQHLLHQIDCERVCLRELALEVDLLRRRQCADVGARLVAGDECEVVLRRGAERLDDELELVHIVLARQQRAPPEQLRHDAADRPDVDCCRVVFTRQQQLRRAVPPRDNVLSHVACFGACACKPKITDLEVARCIEQQVAWLQIAVQHVGTVHVLQATQHLVDEILVMLVRQWLRGADDLMQIGVHELVDCVDVVVVVAVRRQLNIAYCDNILMMQVTQQLDFAKRAPSVGEVFEGVADFLDGHLLSRHLVLRGTHDAIGPLPDRFDWDVLVVNLEDASPNNVAGLAGHVAFLAHRQVTTARGR
mmetsp:Transcript_33334/g.99266  ORF Transcript_33334/g.99266 Transcript_33334/m.99266 type:complete len:427 (-) Transcript_33334:1908-3188(-)